MAAAPRQYTKATKWMNACTPTSLFISRPTSASMILNHICSSSSPWKYPWVLVPALGHTWVLGTGFRCNRL